MNLGYRHWLAAIALAVVLHGGVAYLVFFQPPHEASVQDSDMGGLEVSINMLARSGSAPQQETSEAETESASEPEPKHDLKPKPEPEPKSETKPALDPEPESEATLAPKSKPETEPEPNPKAALAPKPESVPKPKLELTPEPKSETVPTPEPKSEPAPKSKPEPKAALAPKSEPAPKSKLEPKAALKPKPEPAPEKIQRDIASPSKQQPASPDGARAPSAVELDYQRVLRRWLEKHKVYPRKSRLRQQEGVVVIAFTVTRDGSVLAPVIVQKSRHKALDDATLKMLKRAQPLPEIPNEIQYDTLRFSVPVRYNLR